MQFLSNEKDKLSTKLQSAMKLIESNGLMNQLQKDHTLSSSSTESTLTRESSSNLAFQAPKPASTSKINKQYVSAYNPLNASTPLLSSALNNIEKSKDMVKDLTTNSITISPIKPVSTSIRKHSINLDDKPTQIITPVSTTPLTKCSSVPDSSISIIQSQVNPSNITSQPIELQLATELTNPEISKQITEPRILPSLQIPKIESNYQFDLNPTPLNISCIQLDHSEQKLVEPVRIDTSSLVIQPSDILVTKELPASANQESTLKQTNEDSANNSNDLKLTTNALIYLLNDIKVSIYISH